MDRQSTVTSVEDDIQPYSLHVSSRYLELTKKKLELTRLPREIYLPKEREWTFGTPKSALEPLIDFWLDGYSWREQEQSINADLPQYRTAITTETSEQIRLHFVHKRSATSDAIPLLYLHGWPGCFLEVHKIIGSLTSPIPTHLHLPEDSPSFHVVAPSIPGFGFSDTSKVEGFGLRETAEVFDKLMRKLGYSRYVVYGSNWGVTLARVLAIAHPSHCIALLTTTNFHPPPPSATLLTRILSNHPPQPPPSQTFPSDAFAHQSTYPQTPSFALCDSPAGLLASLLHHLYASNHLHLWSPSDVLNWAMLLWLPGPEGALRWLFNAERERAAYEGVWSGVPCGVHVYRPLVEVNGEMGSGWSGVGREGGVLAGLGRVGGWIRRGLSGSGSGSDSCAMERVQRVVWRKNSMGSVGIPSWDAGGDVVLALRGFCAAGLREGWIDLDKGEQQNHRRPVEESKEGVHDRVDEQPVTPAIPVRSGYLSWLWPRRKQNAPSDEEKQRNPDAEIEQARHALSPETPMTIIVAEPTSPRPGTAITVRHDSKSPAKGLGIRDADAEERRRNQAKSLDIQEEREPEVIPDRPFTLKWPIEKKVKEKGKAVLNEVPKGKKPS